MTVCWHVTNLRCYIRRISIAFWGPDFSWVGLLAGYLSMFALSIDYLMAHYLSAESLPAENHTAEFEWDMANSDESSWNGDPSGFNLLPTHIITLHEALLPLNCPVQLVSIFTVFSHFSFTPCSFWAAGMITGRLLGLNESIDIICGVISDKKPVHLGAKHIFSVSHTDSRTRQQTWVITRTAQWTFFSF